jgi:hypothetical protein
MRSSTCETSQCYDWPRSIQRSHIAPIPLCLGWIILAGPLSFFFLCALKHARVHVLQPRTRGPHGVLADHFVQPLNSFVLLVNRRHDVLEPLDVGNPLVVQGPKTASPARRRGLWRSTATASPCGWPAAAASTVETCRRSSLLSQSPASRRRATCCCQCGF